MHGHALSDFVAFSPPLYLKAQPKAKLTSARENWEMGYIDSSALATWSAVRGLHLHDLTADAEREDKTPKPLQSDTHPSGATRFVTTRNRDLLLLY